MEQTVLVKRLREGAILPKRGSADAAGADLSACTDETLTVKPQETAFVPTGISVEIPRGYVGLVFARSSVASKRDLAPANKVGVIDSDYRGEVCVSLHNHGTEPAVVAPHERIAQLVIVPVLTPAFEIAESLTSTERGSGGFGSTGMK
jgi:dUTP pyrophosphatase